MYVFGRMGWIHAISEYTAARKGRRDHNLHSNSITVSLIGLGISFWSDKTTHDDPTAKHHFVFWSFLPSGSYRLFQEFHSRHPKKARYYFVREDGRPLTYEEFNDLLDTVLITTRWRLLEVHSHGMRIGTASYARMTGQNILNIRDHGRWLESGKTIAPYQRLPFLALEPSVIYQNLTPYRRKWSSRRLQTLSQHAVQTIGDETHVFYKSLYLHMSHFIDSYNYPIPTRFPAAQSRYRMRKRQENVASGAYLQHLVSEELHAELQLLEQQQLSQITCRATLHQQSEEFFASAQHLRSEVDILGKTTSRTTQTPHSPAKLLQHQSTQVNRRPQVVSPKFRVFELDPQLAVSQGCEVVAAPEPEYHFEFSDPIPVPQYSITLVVNDSDVESISTVDLTEDSAPVVDRSDQKVGQKSGSPSSSVKVVGQESCSLKPSVKVVTVHAVEDLPSLVPVQSPSVSDDDNVIQLPSDDMSQREDNASWLQYRKSLIKDFDKSPKGNKLSLFHRRHCLKAVCQVSTDNNTIKVVNRSSFSP